jgi:hypothetical protein
MTTPWGIPIRVTCLEDGINFVLTSEHGGLMLEKGYAEDRLSYPARKRGLRFGDFYTYEMDYAWAVPLWELPHLWKVLGIEETDVEKFSQRHLNAVISKHFLDYLGEYWFLQSYALCSPAATLKNKTGKIRTI